MLNTAVVEEMTNDIFKEELNKWTNNLQRHWILLSSVAQICSFDIPSCFCPRSIWKSQLMLSFLTNYLRSNDLNHFLLAVKTTKVILAVCENSTQKSQTHPFLTSSPILNLTIMQCAPWLCKRQWMLQNPQSWSIGEIKKIKMWQESFSVISIWHEF